MSDLLGLHVPRENKLKWADAKSQENWIGENELDSQARKVWQYLKGILIHHLNISLMTQSVQISARWIDLWRMSYF